MLATEAVAFVLRTDTGMRFHFMGALTEFRQKIIFFRKRKKLSGYMIMVRAPLGARLTLYARVGCMCVCVFRWNPSSNHPSTLPAYKDALVSFFTCMPYVIMEVI